MSKAQQEAKRGNFKVEKNIPLVPLQAEQFPWPFAEMDVGDSFLLLNQNNNGSSARMAASRYRQRNTGFEFTIRKTHKGLRFWRLG